MVLVPSSDSSERKEAEAALREMGHEDFRCYLDGMGKLKEEKPEQIQYPRFIKFKVIEITCVKTTMKKKEIEHKYIVNRSEIKI